ncbi:glutamine synthetase [Aeropyrum pernix]|uniref:Glutamine synthetase n=2 Tax=Aeropyrum pernix TaxID=56636 RepID=A0A401HAH3_AERPX|nr:glutamine synthetase [Aeropyrum pernix]
MKAHMPETEPLRNSGGQMEGRVLVHYTDVAGYLRQVEVPLRNVEKEFIASFDGSSVYGFTPIEKSDLLLKQVPDTLVSVPWRSRLWRVIATVYSPTGERSPLDPRLAAERVENVLSSMGYRAKAGAEIEFFIFDKVGVDVLNPARGLGYIVESREQPGGQDGIFGQIKKSYHMPEPPDSLLDYRLMLTETLQKFKVDVAVSHHEVAVSQVEVSIGSRTSLARLGDDIMTVKWVSKVLARMDGRVATFMPKPIFGDNGSGMHIHLSLWSPGGENLFAGHGDSDLSETALHFIAGILEHARSLSAILSPTTNSYRRLVAGYEAPVYVAWGWRNRSAMIRIPASAGNMDAVRIEVRSPDPTANPYLALAALFMAGLDGIKKKLAPPDPYEGNLYKISPEELREKGIKTLPRNLDEALDELESDNDYLKPAFTREMLESYIEVKRKESEDTRLYPHPIEVYKYLNL